MNGLLRTALATALLAATASAASAGEPEWFRRFLEFRMTDYGHGVATGPDGRVHVVGANNGYRGDAFMITLDGDGNELWRSQPGTPQRDAAYGIATDAAGGVVVVGETHAVLGGGHKGAADVFVLGFDRDGQLLWKRQPGTSGWDYAYDVATDADGNVYVVGTTLSSSLGGPSKGGWDAFVLKFDRDGHSVWKRQPGTSGWDAAFGVATDPDGNVYVVGETEGALAGANKGGSDAFVIKFDRDGHYLWARQPGTSGFNSAADVAADADGNVYVVGTTFGWLGGAHKGDMDAFVMKYDRDGRTRWRDQPGTAQTDRASGVATDVDGNVYVTGRTSGSLAGANRGAFDGFVIAYDPDGRTLWADQPGSPSYDWPTGVATDADGNIYVAGKSNEGTAWPSTYGAFLIKYGPGGPQ